MCAGSASNCATLSSGRAISIETVYFISLMPVRVNIPYVVKNKFFDQPIR
jgi:hypothetical protein